MLKTIRESGKWIATLYLFSKVALSGAWILIYATYGWLIDVVISKDWDAFLYYALLLFSWKIAAVFFVFMGHLLKSRYSARLTHFLREKVIKLLIETEDYYKVVTRSSGHYLPWILDEVESMHNAIFSFFDAIDSTFATLLIFITIGSFHPLILLVAIFFLCLGLLIPTIFSKIFDRYGKKNLDLEREHSDLSLNFFKGFHLFLLAKRVANMCRELLKISKRIYKSRQTNEVRHWLLYFFMFFLQGIFIFLLSALLVFSIYKGLLPFSSFFIVINFFGMAQNDVDKIREGVKNILSTKFLFRRFKDLTSKKSLPTLIRDLEPLQNLTLRNLTLFFDQQQPIFTSLSLEFKKGRKYLLTAPSGSGKSSLTFIITGLLTNYSGEIFWNNISFENISPKTLREKIYLLTNDSQIFKASVFDNITLFDKGVSKERITQLLEVVGLSNFRVEEEISANLISKGQAQRIALARALLADKEILILDEALSGVDLEERKRIEAFLLSKSQLTLINFTHQKLEESTYDQVLDLREVMEIRESLRGESV